MRGVEDMDFMDFMSKICAWRATSYVYLLSTIGIPPHAVVAVRAGHFEASKVIEPWLSIGVDLLSEGMTGNSKNWNV
jgi:hypothetical protein